MAGEFGAFPRGARVNDDAVAHCVFQGQRPAVVVDKLRIERPFGRRLTLEQLLADLERRAGHVNGDRAAAVTVEEVRQPACAGAYLYNRIPRLNASCRHHRAGSNQVLGESFDIAERLVEQKPGVLVVGEISFGGGVVFLRAFQQFRVFVDGSRFLPTPERQQRGAIDHPLDI